MRSRLLFFVLVGLGFVHSLSAQKTSEVGLFAGLAAYQGDLAPSPFDIEEVNFSTGAVFRHMFNPKLALKVNAFYAKLSGTDNRDLGRIERGATMNSNLLEFAANFEYHPLGRSRYANSGFFNRQFSPYIGVGLGLALSNYELKGLPLIQQEEKKSAFLVTPVTLGLRLDMTKAVTVTLDIGSRPAWSDNLEGISKNGFSNNKDWYLIGGMTVLYVIDAEAGRFGF
ncbi:MAG: hypothetical protein KDD12_05135 [Lewinella sp.]|nr:hypothetical protein [Lewinella sp.]